MNNLIGCSVFFGLEQASCKQASDSFHWFMISTGHLNEFLVPILIIVYKSVFLETKS